MESYIGEIKAFAGPRVPANWQICNGAILSISGNQELFSVIGNIYGGDGRNTFALPDLRGTLPISQGAGPGLTNRTIGQFGGQEGVTITSKEIPAHNHAARVSAEGTAANAPSAATYLSAMYSPTGTVKGYLPSSATGITISAMNQNAISTAEGGGQAHDNVMPSLAINYIICMKGIFPPRS
ncbi:MAG: phage tail protein [Bacteroidales bacterium]|nr:phage tail protein [Bacteroidales bacterium]